MLVLTLLENPDANYGHMMLMADQLGVSVSSPAVEPLHPAAGGFPAGGGQCGAAVMGGWIVPLIGVLDDHGQFLHMVTK